MIITITPNTALDRTLFVPAFKNGAVMRATRALLSMAAKGTDASLVLAELGEPTTALGFAAGIAGRQMESMLRQRGVQTDFTWVEGETRVNTVVMSEDGEARFTICADALIIHPEHVSALQERYRAALGSATCIIVGGSLPSAVPADLHAGFIEEARRGGLPVILDASGPGLLAGLKAGPTVVKPNQEELAQLAGHSISGLREAYQAAVTLRDAYGASVVTTMGPNGALAVLPTRVYHIPPMNVEVRSTAGAGDAVLAGLGVALSRGEALEEGLRLGFAAAAAVLATDGTADCRREDVMRFVPQVRLIPYRAV
jgi:1-phosphofructokinase family hexose kinase